MVATLKCVGLFSLTITRQRFPLGHFVTRSGHNNNHVFLSYTNLCVRENTESFLCCFGFESKATRAGLKMFSLPANVVYKLDGP